jgi:hypothetical protein
MFPYKKIKNRYYHYLNQGQVLFLSVFKQSQKILFSCGNDAIFYETSRGLYVVCLSLSKTKKKLYFLGSALIGCRMYTSDVASELVFMATSGLC